MLGSKLDIFKSEWLDVVFEGRNKVYGAYELRKLAPKATNIGVLVATSAFVFALVAPKIPDWLGIESAPVVQEETLIETDVILSEPPPIDETEPPPPAVEPPPPRTDQVKSLDVVTVPKEQVRDEEPPTVEQLKLADPGSKTLQGNPDARITIGTPKGQGRLDAEVTQAGNPDEVIPFTSMENPPRFKGDLPDWIRRNWQMPAAALEAGLTGRLIINFTVERDGKVSNVRVEKNLGFGTTEAAMKMMERMPAWSPGLQNGRPVRVAYSLPIVLGIQ
jgi:protein TonB